MFNLPYYLKKRIIDYVIHFIMLIILAFTLFPIGWMVFTSLKENTDILVGKIPFSHAHNNVVDLKSEGNTLWVLTSDGGINKVNRKTLKEESYVNAQTSGTHFLINKKYVWVSSSNRGLLRYDKTNLKSKKEYNLNLPKFDRSQVVGTTIIEANNKIYFAMQYKGFEKIFEFDIKAEKISRAIDIENKLSPSQVRSLLVSGNTLFAGLDNGLLKINLSSGKIENAYDITTSLPLGVAYMEAINGNLVIAGNTGAYIFNPLSGSIVQKITSSAVGGLAISNSRNYMGFNRGFYEYNTKTNKLKAAEMLFRPVDRTGTVLNKSGFAPGEVINFSISGNSVYIGSTYGRVSAYNLASGKVVNTTSARQGAIVISWVNYIDMWKNVDFGLYLKNSFLICGAATLFAMIFATMAAYALARFDFPGAKVLSLAILATQMVPGIMFLIPIYSNFVKFSEITGVAIKGTYWGLIFVYAVFFIPFSIWILRGFFAAIPMELEEAARIDGCSPFQVFWYVVLPLAVPGIIATGIYVFLTAWDELILAWVLTSGDTMTIPVGIRNFVGNYQNRFDLIMAAAVVATAPVMTLFFLLQKYIVKGLTAGAVKG